ncbi:uncharacterized protein V1516DRAFT_418883 [Lipomyces oligophaga]|uniref:uncharacterized protein n=1 Tax=Lipomyces oligophaga TaxID=45792 RepID=UPI0034CD257B
MQISVGSGVGSGTATGTRSSSMAMKVDRQAELQRSPSTDGPKIADSLGGGGWIKLTSDADPDSLIGGIKRRGESFVDKPSKSPERQNDFNSSPQSHRESVSGGSGGESPELTDSSKGRKYADSESSLQVAKPTKRRKVEHACVYCRRSHMTCDSARPCSRCVKRNIGHLCHDESKDQKPRTENLGEISVASESKSETMKLEGSAKAPATIGISSQGTSAPLSLNTSGNVSPEEWNTANNSTILLSNLTQYQQPLFYSEGAGSEFSSLNDFLTLMDDPVPRADISKERTGVNSDAVVLSGQTNIATAVSDSAVPTASAILRVGELLEGNEAARLSQSTPNLGVEPKISHLSARANGNLTLTTGTKPVQVPETAKDKFFLTAADPADGPERTPEERLKQVINAKLEAGLLAPFNYVKGYARLQRYMDRHMAPASRTRILKPLSIFRPAFRAIAQTLIDVDLVLVEEAFERMLLDYDRVFTSMAIPACLWRRTGEIYRGNKEFAALVEVPVEELRDGRLGIYELLSEDSAVNYWEKYGNIAFDSGQKAVLTSCTLRSRDGRTRRTCCFSFTIRRDRYNIPSCIIGNFIPMHV